MPKRILVVDDCEDVRFLLALKLNNMGFDVSEATDGEDAYEILEDEDSDNIDVLLLDVMMPKLTGEQLIEKLKEENYDKELKIICITAYYDEELHEKLKNLGVFNVLKKPIKGNELNKRLNEVIKKAS